MTPPPCSMRAIARDRCRIALGAAALLLSIGTACAATLDIDVSGFASAEGHAVAKLFIPGDNVLGPGRWQATAPIADGHARLTFANVEPGSYAVVVFHDRNDSGAIDHNALRMPVEALGFSNGFALGMLSGLPSFEKLKFEFTSATPPLAVRVN